MNTDFLLRGVLAIYCGLSQMLYVVIHDNWPFHLVEKRQTCNRLIVASLVWLFVTNIYDLKRIHSTEAGDCVLGPI